MDFEIKSISIKPGGGCRSLSTTKRRFDDWAAWAEKPINSIPQQKGHLAKPNVLREIGWTLPQK